MTDACANEIPNSLIQMAFTLITNVNFLACFLCEGAQVIHQPSEAKVHLDSGNVYQVSTRQSFPQDPLSWHTEGKKKKQKKPKKGPKRIDMPQHGYKKWNKLPEPLQVHFIFFFPIQILTLSSVWIFKVNISN